MQLKADVLGVEVVKVKPRGYVLAMSRPQRGFMEFISPEHSTKKELKAYCTNHFDDVLRFMWPETYGLKQTEI
ncbi:hypothetical protein [Pseudomonas chlororaphis]|uniref:hypothetical protein n=1 Tax=Pseudomonas chlororaphis TaxID=587753 RepID=UPI002D793B29|nr:hypothetical protein [Pseudomonas chlororaphis]